MLESATVALKYQEFKELVDKANEVEKLKKKNVDLKGELEDKDERKALDEIFDLLDKASEHSNANEKQYFIYKSMEKYCSTFGIPLKELMKGVSKGIEPK